MRVLLVDDEQAIVSLVATVLERRGFVTVAAATVTAALERVERERFDIAILDLGLPDGSGIEVLDRVVRLAASTHVVVISAESDEDRRVEVLERGADDYVTKPFSVHELAARIAAVRRRRVGARGRRLAVGGQRDDGVDRTDGIGEIVIDTSARTVTVGGALVELTTREFDLLAHLARNAGRVFDRDQLLHDVWQSSRQWQRESTVTEHVRRLRTKLDPTGARPEVIRTVRGVGYCIDQVRHLDEPVVADRDDEPPLGGQGT